MTTRIVFVLAAIASGTSIATPAQGAKKSLHTHFFFSFVKSHWVEQAHLPEYLGSKYGWSCTASPIALSEDAERDHFRTAEITCIHANGFEATIGATCPIDYEAKDNGSVRLTSQKGGETVVVAITCRTLNE